MTNALRNRVILLALLILAGQLTLVVHATAHDADINCQLCLSQTHHAKAIPVAKLFIPQVVHQNEITFELNKQKFIKTFPNAFSQRAPPVSI